MQPKLDPVKKQRERELIDQFLRVCPDFSGFKFVRFEENPDAVYQNGQRELGFDSIIISQDQAAIQCHYSPELCELSVPTKLSKQERDNQISVFFENKLFDHLRRYSLPTVLVFSLIEPQAIGLNELAEIARRFKLPEFTMFNIFDYYICDGKNYVKISETGQGTRL